MENTRELILDMLMEILEKGVYSHLLIREVLDKYNYLDVRDRAFVKRITEGTLERLIEIDFYLDQYSRVPVSRMKPLIRNLLRMSVYQILYMDSVPDSAVCNEAVKLAGKRGFRGLSGFVNGVLRNLARNRHRLLKLDREKEKYQYLSIRYSMPLWLVERWMVTLGEELTYLILEGFLTPSPLTVRLREDLSREQKKAWLLDLEKAGVKVEEHPYLSCAYRLRNTEGVKSLPGYGEGLFVVQDVSSMLVTEAVGLSQYLQALENSPEGKDAEKRPEAGELVILDVCAAPGGKAMHMAEKIAMAQKNAMAETPAMAEHTVMSEKTAVPEKGVAAGKVIARDISEYKVSLMRDNIERMGYHGIETQVYDAARLDKELIAGADVVLADLPCSGLGVIGKKRDIKHRVTPERLEELACLQRQILSVVWQYVKPGGILIYSTCTINPQENEEMAQWITENFPFTLEDLSPFLPQTLKEEGKSGMLQLFPGRHETDGFFIARLRRAR